MEIEREKSAQQQTNEQGSQKTKKQPQKNATKNLNIKTYDSQHILAKSCQSQALENEKKEKN